MIPKGPTAWACLGCLITGNLNQWSTGKGGWAETGVLPGPVGASNGPVVRQSQISFWRCHPPKATALQEHCNSPQHASCETNIGLYGQRATEMLEHDTGLCAFFSFDVSMQLTTASKSARSSDTQMAGCHANV